jgi:hypothetical protein
MVLAFGESESATTSPKGIVTDLCVVVHVGYESVGVCFVEEGVFDSLEVVVVDKACHANTDAVKTVCREVGGAVTKTILQIEVDAAVESPCAVRGWAALSSAIDSEVGTVEVVTSGNAKKSLDAVEGVFEHVALILTYSVIACIGYFS